MTTEKLIEFLKLQEKNNLLLSLQGIIITTILIEKMQLLQEEDKLILQNKENQSEMIGFNLSQLMKITKIKENEILLEFDQLQTVIITIKNKIKEVAINQKEK